MLHLILAALAVVIAANVAAIIVIAIADAVPKDNSRQKPRMTASLEQSPSRTAH